MKKIYIAGFDVFELNAVEIGKTYVKLCEAYGYIGLFPLDNEVDFSQDKKKIAMDIFLGNKKLIDEADIVIANLNPFRGKEADSGTIWECGYAAGQGKEVYAYIEDGGTYIDKFAADEKMLLDNDYVDVNMRSIEDFDYPFNLMIACSVKETVIGGFEDVLKRLPC